LRADLKISGGAKATLVSVLPQIRLPDDRPALEDDAVQIDRETSALQLHGGVATIPVGGGAAVDLTYFRLIERDLPAMPTRDRPSHPAGARIFREPKAGAFDFDAEVLGQWGEISAAAAPDSPRQDVSASYIHLEAGRQWAGGWRPRLGLEYDRASGDEPGG